MAAETYLTKGAQTLASSAWEDTTGAQAAFNLIIPYGGQTIDTALDIHTNIGTTFRIEKLFKGIIGSPSNPLIIRVSDGTPAEQSSAGSEGYVYYGADEGELYIQAYATTGVDNLIVDTGGLATLLGGTFGWYRHINGGGNVSAATVVNYGNLIGGNTKWLAASSTTPTGIKVWGGQHTFQRPVSNGAGKLEIFGGECILDIDSATASIEVWIHGGKLTHRSGNITTLYHMAGVHDYTDARRRSTVATCYRNPNLLRNSFRGVRSGGMMTFTNDYTYGFTRDAA